TQGLDHSNAAGPHCRREECPSAAWPAFERGLLGPNVREALQPMRRRLWHSRANRGSLSEWIRDEGICREPRLRTSLPNPAIRDSRLLNHLRGPDNLESKQA